MAPTLVIAGLSVRAAAQAAQRDGFDVIALDAFGDADTRAASCHWRALATRADAPWQIDPASLQAALAEWASPACAPALAPATAMADAAQPAEPAAAASPAMLGLLLGSGFAAEGARLFDVPGAPGTPPWPLLGTALAAIDRVRDPAAFFAALTLDGIAHPPTRLRAPAPAQAAGWLVKDFAGSGGAQVQPAEAVWPDAGADTDTDTDAPLPFGARSRRHWQQRLVGEPQSLTVIGNGRRAALLGLNRQRLQPGAGCAHRFGGLIGPLPWTAAQAAALQQLADRLVRRFALRGLCSIDLLRVAAADDVAAAEGAEAAIPASLTTAATEATGAPEAPEATDIASPWRVLEVNPRLPASLALYGGAGGLMRAHVAACLRGELPDPAALAALRGTSVQGFDLAYADAPLLLGAAQVARLHAGERAGWWHDVPPLPSRRDAVAIPAGAPLCTLAAAAADADAVAAQLAQRRQQLAALLHPEPRRAAGAARAPFDCLTQDLTP